jgi:23S rRNA (cytidine1920-2'-O)/16S rRNA (cytidine1409-2'-O)-methyltransferase
VIEGVNARSIAAAALPEPAYDLIVVDLSFISLTLVLPALVPLARGDLLLLVKPQFELQPGEALDKAAYARVEARIRAACAHAALVVRDWFESPITGADGNREFFVHATKGETA